MITTIPYLRCFLLGVCLSLVSASAFSQDTSHVDSLRPPINRKVRKFERVTQINAAPEVVFAFMDDINNTGRHMTESNAPMAGGKLKLEWLSENKTGLNSKYKWTGKVMGMKMKFTVLVTQWDSGKSKTWGTIGQAEMIVISWFKMNLELEKNKTGTTTAKLSIFYTKSKNIAGFLAGKRYSIWCVKSMLKDTKKHFKNDRDK